jgi:hypothetical protein
MREIQLSHGGQVMGGDEPACFGNILENQTR